MTVDSERSLALIQKGTIFVTEMFEICYKRVDVDLFRWFILPETGVFGVIMQCNLPEMKAYTGLKQGFV